MSPEQNKIMGYFIQEAQQHLNTIEQCLLDLTSTLADADQISEMFRGAHSIKGGAAMLGLKSIQQIAHGLEDSFKILKEVPVDVDRTLESLLSEAKDSLKTLLAHLSSSKGLSEQDAAQISSKAKPTIAKLMTHLESLTEKAPVVSHSDGSRTQPKARAAPVEPAPTLAEPVSVNQPTLEEDSALQLIFKSDIPKLLQHMLETFKQRDGAASRQHLGEICRNLRQAGELYELREWSELIQIVTLSCQNSQKTYHALAPVILKEIKQARQLVLTGKATEIQASQELKLLSRTVEPEQSLTDRDPTNLKQETLITMTPNSHDPADWVSEELEPIQNSLSNSTQNESPSLNSQRTHVSKKNYKASSLEKTKGPEVGAAELNTLADLFEEIEITGWDEEIFKDREDNLSLEIIANDSSESNENEEDFSDLLLFDSDEINGEPSSSVSHLTEFEENNEEDFLDEISRLTVESSQSNSSQSDPAMESLTGEVDDSFEDLINLDDLNDYSEKTSSSSQFEDLNSLFDEASDEELDLNWQNEMESLDVPPASEDLDMLLDLEDPDLPEALNSDALEKSGSIAESSNLLEPLKSQENLNQVEDDLDLIFSELSELEKNEQPMDSDFEGILSIDASANLDEEVNYDDLFSIDDSTSNLEINRQNQSLDSATESLEDLFGDLPDSEENNLDRSSVAEATESLESLFKDLPETNDNKLELSIPSDGGTSEDFADIFGEDEPDLESFATPVSQSEAEEELEDWLNLNLVETEEEEPKNPDFSDLENLFDEEFSSDDRPGTVAQIQSETEAFFEDDLGLNVETRNFASLQLADESALELSIAQTDATDLDALLELPFDRSNESELDIFDRSPIESESTSNGTTPAETFDDAFNDLESMLDRDAHQSTSSTVEFAELEELLDESSGSLTVDFVELEAFLAQKPSRDFQPLWFTELQELLGEDKSESPDLSISPQKESVKAVEENQEVEATLPVKEKSAAASTSRVGGNYETMRVPVKQLDNLGNLIGELVVNRNTLEQDQERMRQFLDNLLHQVQNLTDVGQRMQDLYERVLLEIALLSSRHNHFMPEGTQQMPQMAHSTGHDLSVFEMDKFTPFHTQAQEILELIVRVRESASDIEFLVDETDQVTRQLRQVTNKLQEGINRSRMVPFAQIADRLPRGVRDNSIKFGKQVELMVEGSETLIDKMILENLNDPMTHLVNNALAHGIEVPEERQRKGKSSTGKITVRAFHQGNQTVISVSDDGAGIDAERVKAKALDKGLITPEEANTLSRLEVYDLLFAAGFSTKDKADDLAGRGVGLDVVRTNLSSIRGVVNIDSTLGKGTSFTIRVPLAFSISKALICISDRARIAFPMDGVEDMLDVPRDKIQTESEEETFIPWRDTMLSFRNMRELLVYHRHLGRGSVFGGNAEEDIISVVVLRSAGNYLALQVDQVLGEQEIVIKQLEGPVPKPIGIAGATVMGDGRIVAIADVLELIDLAAGRISDKASSIWEQTSHRLSEEAVIQEQTTVLIVDDSITVRELLTMTFNKAGYRVEQARDGQEAWEKLKSGLPCNIVLCDIEMPRMDGLELLSRLQKDSQLSHLPMAMLTSRGAKKHMQMAVDMGARGYFTKPYLEEALLEAASRMLKGEVLVASASEV